MSDTLFDTDLPARMRRSAEISPCGQYRWWLRRSWGGRDDPAKVCCFIMLNPSTADAEIDDQTIRRCIAFAKREGCTTLSVRNLFALRSTDPDALRRATDPVGPSNDSELRAALTADLVIAAWGSKVPVAGRDRWVMRHILGGAKLWCLGTTKDGYPRHPLYVKGDKALEPFVYVEGKR